MSTATQIAAIVFLFVAPCTALAECWMVGNFAGYSAKASNRYEMARDGLSNMRTGVNFNGNESSVTHVPGSKCTEISPTAIVCVARDGEKAITETYSIDPSMQKAFITHLRSGYGTLDGAGVYVGNILGQCK